MNVSVSIPASLGGYTGQRDAWEELPREWKVDLHDGVVTLAEGGTAQRKLTFRLDEFNEAIVFLTRNPHHRP